MAGVPPPFAGPLIPASKSTLPRLYHSKAPIAPEVGTEPDCGGAAAGLGSWPQGVPVQIHGMDADPFFVGEGDIDAARALVEEAEDAELFLYPGDQHYFADSTLPSYNADAATLLRQRVLDFLATR